MSAESFEINGRKFKLNKVDAMQQFHIARRIGPLLSEILPVMGKIAKQMSNGAMETMTEEQKFDEMSKAAAPFMNGLSKLSDQDSEFVLFRLLNSVEVHQPEYNSWARVASHAGIAMQDIDLPILLQAAGRALFFNLSGFLASGPQKSGAKPKQV
jgi:hypothetical protein